MMPQLTRTILENIRSGRLDAGLGAELLTAWQSEAARPSAPAASTNQASSAEPIAVVGMSGSFPDAPDIASLWRNLVTGRDMVREIDPMRWRAADYYTTDTSKPNTTDCKWQGMVPGIDTFDPLFFSVSPKEARSMDPQQRLLIQESWRAVEDAGYTPAQLSAGSCGVYIGVTHGDYEFRAEQAGLALDAQSMTGSLISMLAARVSYQMNLSGPNLSIDTACSSSLVALCLAAQALREGSCDAALAGGVSIFTTPRLYLMAGKGGMLSATGRCHTFDERADGFVPAEAVGVVLLKRLSDAERDQDHIYGVIEAFGTNHDGRTNGMTAPSPESQFKLIDSIYRREGVDPRTISYVEAHGTGTRLGDPIEINALTKAFRQHTADNGFCRIGSVKSNLGHPLGAAGIVSLIKVMTCLQEARLVGNLHFEQPSRQIDFAQTPFEVCAENQPWTPGPDGSRRAAISSFGLSGTNAHMVVRDHPKSARSVTGAVPQPLTELVVLSAQSTSALRDNIAALADWLDLHPQVNWDDLVFTLADGRQAMDHRVAVVASSPGQLRTKLARYTDQAELDAQVTTVQAGLLGGPETDPRFAEVVARLRRHTGAGRAELVSALAEFVLAGHDLPPYAQIHPDSHPQPHRLALPTYRFVPESYWIDQPAGQGAGSGQPSRTRIEIPRRASYLEDHRFAGAPVVPGARWLDLIDQHFGGENQLRVLADVRWAQLGGPDASFELISRDDGQQRSVEIFGPDDDEPVVTARTVIPSAETTATFLAARLDTRLLDDTEALRIDAAELYQHFAATGMSYGPSFQGITAIDVHEAGVVAHLDPPKVADLDADAILHPHALDAVFQTVAAFKFIEAQDAHSWYLPHSVGELRYTTDFSKLATAVVRRNEQVDDATIRSFDIDVFDGAGTAVAQILDYRIAQVQHGPAAAPPPDAAAQPVFLTPTFVTAADPVAVAPGRTRIDADWPLDIATTIGAVTAADPARGVDLVVSLPAERQLTGHALPELLDELVRPVFELIAELANRAKDADIRVLLMVGDDHDSAAPIRQVFDGFARSVRHEEPRLQITALYCAPDLDPAGRAKIIATELAAGDGALTVRHGPQRQVRTLAPAELAPIDRLPEAIRPDGVFLLVGGLGGLGALLAADLLDRGTPRLVLAGRSEPDESKLAAITAHARDGGRVEYLRCDVSDRPACERLVEQIIATHGRLDGVVYCAGTLRDSYLRFKPWTDAREVLAVKSVGLANIDRATAGLPLDFFVGYSSIGSLQGNIGQTDYAMANAFMDAYLRQRAERVAAGEAHGRSCSVNWPFWSEGGMRPDDASLAVMAASFGLAGLSTRDGLGALYALLDTDQSQCAVLAGDPEKLTRNFVGSATWADGAPGSAAQSRDEAVPASADDKAFAQQAHDLVRRIIARGLEMDPERIAGERPFEQYGLDSVLTVTINALLEESFPKVSKTLLYEYQNLDDLTGYFVGHRAEDLRRLLGADEAAPAPAPAVPAEPTRPQVRLVSESVAEPPAAAEATPSEPDAIAIVGMSGRFPRAESVAEFWQNLTQGIDAITEIPAERWDPETGWFDAQAQRPGSYASKWGGFVESMRDADPLMFGMSPRDAEQADPQERIFLQTCWETLQDAGYSRDSVRGTRTGVFVGVMYNHYQLYGAVESALGTPLALNSNSASIANRVSYTFDLAGPSLALDTMCSSSISSIHLACQAIRDGDCELALAGGVNATLHENKYQLLGSGNFLSSDGRCRSYGEGGDGYVPGEGVGCVLLKPLDQARADGDQVYAIVRGSALNHGGKTNGYTVPNPIAQARVVQAAMERAGLTFDDLSYVEGHGTGTSLGDPIEINGLIRALGERHAGGPCALGSVKSNIGHLESAAGIASLIKVVLMMQHRSYVPSLHSAELNPNIDFESAPFEVVQELAPWDAEPQGGRRRALITGFGAGGSNGALVIEDGDHPVRRQDPGATPIQRRFLLSARSTEALTAYAGDLATELAERRHQLASADLPGQEAALLSALQYTLLVGRDQFRHRLLIETGELGELIAVLQRIARAGLGHQDGEGWRYRQTSASGSPIEADQTDAYRAELARGDLDRLAERWLEGHQVEWTKLTTEAGAAGRLAGLPWPRPELKTYWYDTHLERTDRAVPVRSGRLGAGPRAVAGEQSQSAQQQQGSSAGTPNAEQALLASLQAQMAELAAGGPRPQARVEIDDHGVAVVTMDQPEHNNSFTAQMIEALMVAFWQVWNDERVGAVVLTGTDRVFSMGGTKDQLNAISRQEISFTDAPFLYAGLLLTQVPVVTAVQGHASGGGFMLGLFGDITVLSEDGVYTSPFTKYGFTPGMGATYILERKLGRNLAVEMMLTARSYTGAELAARGAGVKAHDSSGVLAEALAIARTIASHPRQTSIELKQHLLGTSLAELLATIELEDSMHERTFVPDNVAANIANYYIGPERVSGPAPVSPNVPAPTAETQLPDAEATFLADLLDLIENGALTPEEALLLEEN